MFWCEKLNLGKALDMISKHFNLFKYIWWAKGSTYERIDLSCCVKQPSWSICVIPFLQFWMLHEWIYWNLYLNFFEKIEHFKDGFCDLNYEYANIQNLKYDNLKFAQTHVYTKVNWEPIAICWLQRVFNSPPQTSTLLIVHKFIM